MVGPIEGIVGYNMKVGLMVVSCRVEVTFCGSLDLDQRCGSRGDV
jgi:hypothetical protein